MGPVGNLTCRPGARAKAFYGDVLGLQPVMDHGWIVTLADPERFGVQVSLETRDATAATRPNTGTDEFLCMLQSDQEEDRRGPVLTFTQWRG